MNKNVKVAKELIKLAKSLLAEDKNQMLKSEIGQKADNILTKYHYKGHLNSQGNGWAWDKEYDNLGVVTFWTGATLNEVGKCAFGMYIHDGKDEQDEYLERLNSPEHWDMVVKKCDLNDVDKKDIDEITSIANEIKKLKV